MNNKIIFFIHLLVLPNLPSSLSESNNRWIFIKNKMKCKGKKKSKGKEKTVKTNQSTIVKIVIQITAKGAMKTFTKNYLIVTLKIP
jgi:hypothetical protein